MAQFRVSFQYSEFVYGTNIAIAECRDDVEAYYSEYEWCSVKEATEYDMIEAERKGMPVVTIEHETEPAEAAEEKETETMMYAEMVEKALDMLNNNDDLFVEMVNELDSWDGFADGFRAYPMWELDDLFCDCKVSDFLQKLAPGFDFRDEYMVDTIYGLDSTNDIAALYRDNVDVGELLDNVIDNYNHLYFSDSVFEALVNDIANYSEDQEPAENPVAGVLKKVAESMTGTAADDPESVTA